MEGEWKMMWCCISLGDGRVVGLERLVVFFLGGGEEGLGGKRFGGGWMEEVGEVVLHIIGSGRGGGLVGKCGKFWLVFG